MSVSHRSRVSSQWTAEAWLLAGITVLGAIGMAAWGWQVFAAEVERIRTHAVVLDQSLYINGYALQRAYRQPGIQPFKGHRYDGDIVCDGILELQAADGRSQKQKRPADVVWSASHFTR